MHLRSPAPLSTLGRTALDVAIERARESERPDRLFDDPYAAAFVEDLAGAATDATETPEEARAALSLQVAVRTAFFDEQLLDACRIGCRQVVLLASGLDARAFRLDWPAGVRLFEIDLSDVMAFKESVLSARGARARCERTSLPIDLREDWPAALGQSGFRPAVPTAWLAEGLLIYLDADEAASLLTTIGGLSARGSQLACERANFADAAVLEQAMARFGPGHFSALWKGGLGYDAADWLAEHGWEVYAHDMVRVAAAYGREASYQLGGGLLTAIRR